MKTPRQFLGLLLLLTTLLTSGYCRAQTSDDDDELGGMMVEDSLVESLMDESGPGSIIIDVTRTKIGRDFYDAFYQHWHSQPPLVAPLALPTPGLKMPPDTSRKAPKNPALGSLNEFIISVEELPTPGTGLASLLSVSIDNQIVWQQFVPFRRDALEDAALDAVDAIRAYITDIQLVQAQLGNDDQSGTGVY
jgi:Curli assembly protein CsgE